jgi:hypothetical protein
MPPRRTQTLTTKADHSGTRHGAVPEAQRYEESSLLEGPAAMTRAVHVPCTAEQDEDGVWCAHAQLRPGVGA